MQWVLNPAASAFYEEAGSAAAALGVTVDIFAASPRTCGLHAVQPLASGSAGCLRLYPSLLQAPMPQVHPSARPLLKPHHVWRSLTRLKAFLQAFSPSLTLHNVSSRYQ